MATQMWWRELWWALGLPKGCEGGIARDGRACGRVHRGELALTISAREAVPLWNWRLVASLRLGCVLECDCALDVFAGEHGRVLPLHEYAHVRGRARGHGRGRGGQWLRIAGSSLIGRGGSVTWLPAAFDRHGAQSGVAEEWGRGSTREPCSTRKHGKQEWRLRHASTSVVNNIVPTPRMA